MERFTYQTADRLSPNVIVIGTCCLAVVLFFAIVFWPSSASDRTAPLEISQTPLAQTLNDPQTGAFLNTLHRVNPKASSALHQAAEEDIASGADKDDLAMLVIGAYGLDPFSDFDVLAKADIRYIEKLLSLGQSGLSALSRSDSKFCRMSTLEQFAEQDADAILAETMRLYTYQSTAYSWTLRFATIKLEAIEDGRRNPKKYKHFTPQDELEMQSFLERILNSRSITRVMGLKSTSEADQKKAIAEADLCEIGAEVLAGLNRLPSDTKGRLMVEMNRLSSKKAMKAFVRERFGDSCGACSRLF